MGDVEVRKVWAARATVWIVVEFVVPIRGETEGETGYLFIFHAIEKSNKAISAEEGRADGKGGEWKGEWGGDPADCKGARRWRLIIRTRR